MLAAVENSAFYEVIAVVIPIYLLLFAPIFMKRSGWWGVIALFLYIWMAAAEIVCLIVLKGTSADPEKTMNFLLTSVVVALVASFLALLVEFTSTNDT